MRSPTGIVRGAFEYQGQKCSAASRAYVPESIWPKVRDRVLRHARRRCRVGDPTDFRNFMGAVIDKKAVRQDQAGYIDRRQERSQG